MGSIDGKAGAIPRRHSKFPPHRSCPRACPWVLHTCAIFFFLFCGGLFPLFSETAAGSGGAVSFAGEISRLEELSEAGGKRGASSRERLDAFLELARLCRLSGDREAALKAYEGALELSPNDRRALLERGRLLFSLGDYEKAGSAFKTLLNGEPKDEISVQAAFLDAQLEAFSRGEPQKLAALAEDPEFAEYRSRIYYTLWKLTGLASWKTRLRAEFPQSPEAKIAAGAADFAPSPLWLLFPGRDGAAISEPMPLPAPEAPRAAAASSPAGPQAEGPGYILQTGLFSREENAKAMAERLKKAGYAAEIVKRPAAASGANGAELWAVTIPGAAGGMNAQILKLKEAGFESFPVFEK